MKSLVDDAAVKYGLARTIYYDARPDSGGGPEIEEYWKANELMSDSIAFGALRGRPRRQKQVDGLIAVDMLSGSFWTDFRPLSRAS